MNLSMNENTLKERKFQKIPRLHYRIAQKIIP